MGVQSKKQEVSLWQRICLYVADHIQVEDRKRTRLGQSIVCMYYFTDYVILWVAIEQSYNPNFAMSFDWPFIIARAILAVSFIITRQPAIFLASKMTLLIQESMALPSFAFLEALVALFEVGMVGIWALTKQQRMLHFDSRFEIAGAFMKQLFFYAMITAQLLLPSGPTQYEGQFIFLGGLVVLTLCDFSEIYYNPLTKAMLLRLDYILLLLAAATIYQSVLGLGYFQFLFASLFLFVVAGLHLALSGGKKPAVLQINSQELGNLPEEALVDAMIQLKRTADGRDTEAIETYLYKMRDESEDAALLEKIAECREKDGASRQELLNSFIFQTLKRAAKSSKRLRDLVIYLYSPSPRLYCFLDLQDWQHLREYRRILAEELNDTTLREAEAEKELQEVKELVLRYTRASKILLQELMKERIRQNKVELYGEELVRLLEQLTKISAADRTKSREVRDLINRFAIDCLPAKYQLVMLRREEGVVEETEEFAQVVVGGEEDNYCRVLEANSCFTKLAYLRKDRHLGRPLASILPAPFIAHLLRHLKQLARHQQAQQLAPAFLFNSLGFAVPVRWKVEASTHRSGRAWKLSLRQDLTEKAILVVTAEGVLQGFSELTRYFSLSMSEKGKKIQTEAMVELKANSLHYLSMGEALFDDHEFYMSKGAVMTVLEEFMLDGQGFWLLEVKESDMRLKSLANPLLKPLSGDPPIFYFKYDWANNKFTTEEVELRALAAGQVEEKRTAFNYAENITEMRYFEEKIDYKSNKEEEAECPSLEPNLHRVSSSLTLNEFYEKWDRKRSSMPLWFKGSVALIVLLCLCGLAGAVFYLTAFNSASASAGTSLQVSTKLQEKLQSAVLLGQLTTLPLTNSSANVSQAIAAQITLTNSLSSQLYALDQNIFNANGGQTILDQLNTLNLYINSYLLTTNYPYRNALTLITTQIVPSFNKFIIAVLNSYAAAASTGGTRTAVLVCLAIACFGIFVGIWAIDFRQGLRRREVAEILKFLDNDDLEAMRERTVRFKQTWLDNVDSREPEEGQQGEREALSPPKHLMPSFRLRRRKAFHLLWMAGLVAFLVVLNNQTSDFVNLTNNYITFQNSLATQVTALQTVWAELNAAAPNITLIQGLASSGMSSEYSKNVMLKSMAGNKQVDDIFISQYGNFWESQNCCNYFTDANCNTIIGGAMTEGANMAICYLNIQHDSYLQNSMSNFSLYTQPSQPSVALLSLYYLPQITQISNQFILSEWSSMQGVYSLTTQYLFIGLVLHSLLVLILLGWAIKERKTTARVQELLMIMPFEKLRTFAAFHKYYSRYYATY